MNDDPKKSTSDEQPVAGPLPPRRPIPPRPPGDLADLADLRAYLDELALYLRFVNPPVTSFPVVSHDPLHTLMFLELDEVCLVTTRIDGGREGETMWLTEQGKRHYSSLGLADIERKLSFPRPTPNGSMDDAEGGNPWFLRTHQSYIVNLRKVRAFNYSSGALTLWFRGLEEPFQDVVSETYRERFDAYFVGIG